MSEYYRCCRCCQSYTATDYILKTLVSDYADPPGADIAPYPRGGDVGGDPCPANGVYGGTGQIPCGPWPFSLVPVDAGAYSLFHEGNQFDASDTPAAVVSICDEPGFKCAQTSKYWHGMLPLNFCADGCTEVSTRYRTIRMKGVVRERADDTVQETTFESQYTVDRYSGEIVKDFCDPESTVLISGSFLPGIAYVDLAKQIATTFRWSCEWIGGSSGTWADIMVALRCLLNGNPDDDLDETERAALLASCDPSALVIDDAINFTSAQNKGPSDLAFVLEFQYPEAYEFPRNHLIKVELELEATNEYTAVNVRTDADAAIVKWEFPNNLLFPWRSDTMRSGGVIACYNELSARSPDLGGEGCATLDDYRSPINDGSVDPFEPGWVPTWDQMDWIDTAAYVWVFPEGEDQTTAAATELRLRYDGAIIGQPFKSGTPTGLPDHMFSWYHITWACYNDMTGEHWEARRHGAYAGENSTGQDASDSVIPKSAPLWTENYPAGFLYYGSWIQWIVDGNGPNELEMQKQIELTQEFNGHNRFGPCGYHRHTPDVSQASCVTGWSGSTEFATGDTITLEDAISDGTYDVVVFGGDNTPKRFSATVTGLNCVLGAEDVNARGVADACAFWTDAVDAVTGDPIDLGDGIIARVRDWKRSGVSFTPPAICGKVVVTGAVQDGSEVVLTVATLYTQIGDEIICVENDASDTVYANNGGAGFTVTAASNTELRYTGTLDAAWVGKYIKILGAPLASFNSTARRRQFVWQEWIPDDATGGFDATPVHTDDSYTGTKILGSTPNVATDVEAKWATAGTTNGYDFPDTPMATTCGGKALVVPVQYVTDPLYQTPFSCGAPITICPPRVEAITAARLTAEGAPALPDGCAFIMPSLPTGAGTDCDTGTPNGWSSPWNLCTPA